MQLLNLFCCGAASFESSLSKSSFFVVYASGPSIWSIVLLLFLLTIVRLLIEFDCEVNLSVCACMCFLCTIPGVMPAFELIY